MGYLKWPETVGHLADAASCLLERRQLQLCRVIEYRAQNDDASATARHISTFVGYRIISTRHLCGDLKLEMASSSNAGKIDDFIMSVTIW